MLEVFPAIAERTLETAGIGGWELDVATGQLHWTALTFRIYELDLSEPPPLAAVIAFFPPEARQAIEGAVAEAIRSGTPWDLELPFITARGRHLWVRTRGRAISEGDKTTKLFGTFEDITARHDLVVREAWLSEVVRQMTNVVVLVDDEGRTQWVNDAFTAATGYTIDDLRGRFPGELLSGPETDTAVTRRIADCVRDGLRFDVEILSYAKDLRTFWMSVIGSPVRDAAGVLTGFISVGTDVTRRRKADQDARHEAAERKRAEALLRDILETLPNGVTAYDGDNCFVLSNSLYAEMFPISARFTVPGRTHEEVIRLAAAHGQYADVPSDLAERETWIQGQMAFQSASSGIGRTLRLGDGRSVQVRERRSAAGTLVTVRSDITDLHVAEENARREAAERERAEALLRDVLDTLPSGVIAYDRDERFILSNQAHAEIVPVVARFATPGRTLEEIIRLSLKNGQLANSPSAPIDHEAWIVDQLAALRDPDKAPPALVTADGRCVQVRTRRSRTGNRVIVLTDITELTRAEALLRDILRTLPSAVMAYDAEERLLLWNQAATKMLPAVAPFAVPGLTLTEMLHLSAEHGQYADVGTTPEERKQWVAQQLATYRTPGAARTLHLPNGRFVQARERRSETGNLVCIRTDTTELMRAEAELRVLAERDPLTLLANRPAFLAALTRLLALTTGSHESGGALLLFDIDYFKQINDSLGHDGGDALLVAIAARLHTLLRTADIAARLGGDEYGVIMTGLIDATSLTARMDAIHSGLSAPVTLAGRQLPFGVSVGVTVFPTDGTDPAKLLKNADLALYEAKRSGRGRWCQFRPEQAAAQEHHVRLADALREALARNQITVHLQAKRRLRGGDHAGFEALARWHDGTRWVPPLEFIPVAEDIGLIGPVGRAVMESALAMMRDIRDQGLDPGRVAVNVTGPQLLDTHFKSETLAALERNGASSADLELEITETVLFGRASERIDTVLREFSDLGVTLALDDFGTGYASLAHLSRLPIDRLKIDRSFVDGIGKGGPGAVIARTVISLAHSLDMESIAEGIETLEQLAFLETAGCDVGQGYLFCKPLPSTAAAISYLQSADRYTGSAASHSARQSDHSGQT